MTKASPWGPLEDLFSHVPLDDRAKAELFQAMSGPTRSYHGIGHLETLWRRHRQYAEGAGLSSPDITTLVACAIAFHDSVYEPGRDDNEERSAQNWLRASAGSSIPEEDRLWVAQTIRATGDHLGYKPDLAPGDPRRLAREQARLWVLDLDLTPLGETPEIFEENTRRLRLESPTKTQAQWVEGLCAFHRHFLAAAHIYRTPALARIFEARARVNLAKDPRETSSSADGG